MANPSKVYMDSLPSETLQNRLDLKLLVKNRVEKRNEDRVNSD